MPSPTNPTPLTRSLSRSGDGDALSRSGINDLGDALLSRSGDALFPTTAMETEGSLCARQDDHTLLWKFVTKLEKVKKGGGNWRWECNYCRGVYTSSYSRVKAHLLKLSGQGIQMCKTVGPHNIRAMRKKMDQAEEGSRASRLRTVSLPTSSTSSVAGGSRSPSLAGRPSEPKRREVNTLDQAFNMGAREELDGAIARMFYTSGLSFNLARNPYFKNAFFIAASNPPPPPRGERR